MATTQRAWRAACPNCGAPVEFASAASASAVCSFCRSTLLREGDALRRIDMLTRGVGPFDDGPVQAIASKRVLRGCEFAVTEARTSKGPEWWAGFAAAGEPFAVSEVSSEDAIARARAYMAAHGWRDDMGAEVGLLLIRAYERGRDDESAARGGIRIHDDDDVAL